MKRKPTAEEKVRAFIAFVDGDDEPEDSEEDDRVLTDAEVDHQLAAAGFDVVAETAKGQAEHEAAIAKLAAAEATATPNPNPTVTATATVTRMPRRPTRWILPVAAAAGFAALVGIEGSAIVAWITGSDEPSERVTHAYDPTEEAHDLRDAAARAMADGQWSRARDLLDRAKGLDPKGDDAPEVQESRRRVQQMLNPADVRPDGAPK
jgi:hypothetical protein